MTMEDRDAAPPSRLTVSDKVYGAIAIVAIVLALVFLVRGGEGDTGVAAARAPRITIEDPRPGATLDQPLIVTFDARTAVGPDGADAAAPRHVHADVNGQMVMPAGGSVRSIGGTRYAWTLPRLPAGRATLRLYWSDAQHAPIAGASSDPVAITLR